MYRKEGLENLSRSLVPEVLALGDAVGSDVGLNLVGVHGVGGFVYIHHDRKGAGQENRFRGGEEGVGHCDDFIVGADSQRLEGQQEGAGSGIHGGSIGSTAEGSELFFEGLHVGP